MRIEQFMYSSRSRRTAQFLLVLMLSEIFLPATAAALTGGPSQPEVQSFEPIGTTEMVDVSSGAFNYNIPLLEVEGYPINLAYHAGQSMDSEASTVGLGWNINPGVVNRNMRGLPDDFNGDQIVEENNVKPNITLGLSSSVPLGSTEVIGLPINFGASMNLGVNYNNYNGVGFEFGVHPHLSMSAKNDPDGMGVGLGLGLSTSTTGGATIAPNLSVGYYRNKEKTKMQSISLGGSFNRRQGLAALNLDMANNKVDKEMKEAGTGTDGKPKMEFTGKRLKGDQTSSAAASVTFGNPTYSPTAQSKMSSLNFGLNFKFNVDLPYFDPGIGTSARGYFSTQFLKESEKSTSNRAFGNLYAQNHTNDDLLDFNREKSMPYIRSQSTNLSVPVMTQDVYGVSGQGIGGSYQLKRNDVGMAHDKSVVATNGGGGAGAELGGTPASLKIGVDIDANVSTAYTGAWQGNLDISSIVGSNQSASNLAYKGQRSAIDEPAYFKSVGDVSIESDQAFISAIGGTAAVRVKLDKDAVFDTKALPRLENSDAGISNSIARNDILPNLLGDVKRTARERRNQAISYLTAEEASALGNEYLLKDYTLLTATPANLTAALASNTIGRTDNTIRKSSHLSVVTTLRNDGVRYVYGVPAYNITQVEKTFAIGATSQAGAEVFGDDKCEIAYNPSSPTPDDSNKNIKGIDNFYHSKKLPAFAHSFLLTNVLSTDYVDRTLNGPSEDDYGSYTKINYGRASENYKWRAPYGATQASYDRGLNENKMDDKASYLSGEKEVWNIHSIESKHQIALFYYSSTAGAGARQDGRGTAGEVLRKLDKIELYTKANYNSTQRTPIKSVFFEYDYTLCTGALPNAATTTNGKLTLKSVYFSYGSSNKAKLNPYVFKYSTQNPSYNPKAYDRWGNYKASAPGSFGKLTATSSVSNADFPYAVQGNKTVSDADASAWNLTEIKLPSGGNIKVEYEASDYAYVQDKKAMEMVAITGVSNTVTGTQGADLFGAAPNYTPNNVLHFNLRTPSNWGTMLDADRVKWFNDNYIGNINGGYLYFKTLVQLNTTGALKYDYVTGFGEVKSFGITSVSPAVGYVELTSVNIADNKYTVAATSSDACSPISKAAWNFMRTNYPDIAFLQGAGPSSFGTMGGSNPGDFISNNFDGFISDIFETAKSLASAFSQIADGVIGVNKVLREGRDLTNKLAKTMVLNNKSWIRLYTPDGKKIGGGYRVKSVTVNDGWDAMGSDANTTAISATYGQTYDYTTQENGRTISSGVVSYEPMMGGDESPFHQPILNNHINTVLGGDIDPRAQLTMGHTLLAGQMGESYFPSPSIVYSKVTVTSLKPTSTTPGVTGAAPAITRHGTGKIVHEYYTAKEFPVIVQQTGLDAQGRPAPVGGEVVNILLSLFKMVNLDYMTASQGYSIETNNMHGQPRNQKVFDENGDLISSVTYNYQVTDGKLNNTVKVMKANGTVNTQQMGVEIQMIADEQESRNTSYTAGIHANFNSLILPLPFPVLTPLPNYNVSDTRYRGITTAKHINRIGILKSTTAVDKGSTVTTESIAYDEETASVILTKVNNDFEDPIYKFTYPAYWRYKGMGLAYQNLGAKGNLQQAVQPGDEVLINNQHLWVTTVGASSFTAIDRDGLPVVPTPNSLGNVVGKIIRSNYRNLASMPMGEIVLKKNPIAAAGTTWFIPTGAAAANQVVLNASATEYAERWQTLPNASYGDCITTENISTGVIGRISTTTNPVIATRSTAATDNKWTWSTTDQTYSPAALFVSTPSNWAVPTTYPATWLSPSVSGGPSVGNYYYKYPLNVPPNKTGVLNIQNIAADDDIIGVELSPAYPTQNNPIVPIGGANCFGCFTSIIALNETIANIEPGDYFLKVIVYNSGGPMGFLLRGTFTTSSHNTLNIAGLGQPMNPYQNGVKGNWRARKAYTYVDERTSSATTTTSPAIRTNGVINDFATFWVKGGTTTAPTWAATPGSKWQWTEEATQITPDGLALESKDPLGRYNAELLGYDNKIVKATVSNSRRREALYDGFEDYIGGKIPNTPTSQDITSHLFLPNNSGSGGISVENYFLSTEQSHTGTTSLKVKNENGVQVFINRLADNFESGSTTPTVVVGAEDYARTGSEVNTALYNLDIKDCIYPFAPRREATKVVVSAWVYGTGTIEIGTYSGVNCPTPTPLTILAGSGPTIEGWRRIYQVVDLPASDALSFTFKAPPKGTLPIDITYFDDLRIMPYDANMKSYVYDNVNFKLRAELDANNFATFYEYDQSGALARVKRETERGIVTVKESRSSLKK
jgi:hypothetical protein